MIILKKVNFQNIKKFLKSKKNLLIIFLFLVVFTLAFYSYLLRKVIIAQSESFDALLSFQETLEEENDYVKDFKIEEIKGEGKFMEFEKNDKEDVNEELDKKKFEKGVSKTYEVEDFSEKYYVKIDVSLYEEDKISGSVTGEDIIFRIFDKRTNEELKNFDAHNVYFWLKDGKVKVNEGELYANGIFFYQDFDLDGIKDFAVIEGNKSCYGGPSFDVYLIKNENFVLSKEFSDLAQDYCGMFEMKGNEILTMTKSGCCWHEFNKFTIINGRPIKSYTRTEDIKAVENSWVKEITIKKLVNGVWTKDVTIEPYDK